MAVSEEIHVDLTPSFIKKHGLNIDKITIKKLSYLDFEILLGCSEQPFSNVIDTLRLVFKNYNSVGLKHNIEGIGYLLCVREKDMQYFIDSNIVQNVLDLLDQYFVYTNGSNQFSNPKTYSFLSKEFEDIFPDTLNWHKKIIVTVENSNYDFAKVIFLSNDNVIVRIFLIEKKNGAYWQINGLNFGFMAKPILNYSSFAAKNLIEICCKFEKLNQCYQEHQKLKEEEAKRVRAIKDMQAQERARA